MAKSEEKTSIQLIGGAIGFGIVAALLAMLYLNAKEAQLKAKYEQEQASTLRVVVANQDLFKGQEITREFFSARQVPDKFVHNDAIFPAEFDNYLGRALTADLGRGKTLLKSAMDDDFPRDFSDVIAKGKRAMTITVDDINSIGGFLRPGNRIDIFVNIPFAASGFSEELFNAAKEAGVLSMLPTDILSDIPGELLDAANNTENPTELIGMLAPDDVIIPVLQNVTVLAAGRDPYQETLDALRQPQRRTESSFSHITVEVDPQQAALITIAEDKGEIVTLLRNRHDETASDFTTVSAPDLFDNASKMASAEKERASRSKVAGGLDVNGNLVDADGNKLMSRKQLADAGYTVNADGQIVDKDGNIVDPSDLVIGPDGNVMTKQQLAAAGLSINESGQIIDANGNVIDSNDVVMGPNGKVMTKEQLAAAGLSVNENGEIVDKNGKVISPNDIVIAEDGTVLTKEQLAAAGIKVAEGVDTSGNLVDANGNVLASKEQLEAAGYTVNENGQIVDKDGNVVDPNSIMIAENGEIVTSNDLLIAADGNVLTEEQLAAAGLSVNEHGQIVDKNGNIVDPSTLAVAADGSIMTQEQLTAAGLSINENGEIVDKNGNVVDKDDLITSANGEILSKKQLEEAGIKVASGTDANGNLVDANGKVLASKEQLAAAGYRINENGEIVDKNGNIVDPSNIMIAKDGKVLSQEKIAAIAQQQKILGNSAFGGSYELVIGGASEDGVAKKTTKLLTENSTEKVKESEQTQSE